jgi:hypothetical protein
MQASYHLIQISVNPPIIITKSGFGVRAGLIATPKIPKKLFFNPDERVSGHANL